MTAFDAITPPLASGARHFLDIRAVEAAELRRIIESARAMKAARAGLPHGAPDPEPALPGRLLAMIFEKPSTRTRVSFDVGMRQLGGETIVLSGGWLSANAAATASTRPAPETGLSCPFSTGSSSPPISESRSSALSRIASPSRRRRDWRAKRWL